MHVINNFFFFSQISPARLREYTDARIFNIIYNYSNTVWLKNNFHCFETSVAKTNEQYETIFRLLKAQDCSPTKKKLAPEIKNQIFLYFGTARLDVYCPQFVSHSNELSIKISQCLFEGKLVALLSCTDKAICII